MRQQRRERGLMYKTVHRLESKTLFPTVVFDTARGQRQLTITGNFVRNDV